jgi:hypothetical protein
MSAREVSAPRAVNAQAYAVPPDQRRQGEPERRPERSPSGTRDQDPGQDDRGDDQNGGESGGDQELGEGDPPARDRLDQQEDRGAVLDLRADRGGPDDECDQRQDRPDHEGVQDLGGVPAPPGDSDEQADQHRERGEQQHQDHAPPAEKAAQRHRHDGPERHHRRTR